MQGPCGEQQVLEAGVVVVTLPLGVLQAGDVEFKPALPKRKQEAIDALGMGLLDKVCLPVCLRACLPACLSVASCCQAAMRHTAAC